MFDSSRMLNEFRSQSARTLHVRPYLKSAVLIEDRTVGGERMRAGVEHMGQGNDFNPTW